MKTKISILAFSISLVLGFLSFFIFGEHNLLKTDCSHLKKNKKQRVLFTLKGVEKFENRKVGLGKKRPFPNKAGRVGRLEMITRDKALLTIYWEDKSNSNGETVILYDKKEFESLEVVD